MNVDLFLFNLINQLAFKNDFLDFFFIVSAKYLGYGLIAFVVFKILTKRSYLFSLIAGFLSYYGIVEIIRMFSFKSRPFTETVCSVLIKDKDLPFFSKDKFLSLKKIEGLK